jgi:hypothetical protein
MVNRIGKDTVNFQQTLNKQTKEFLERWYELPIQEILRTLATVDKTSKEAQKR